MDLPDNIQEWIKEDEGLRLHPYLDTTGHVTIGWGRNLDNGISHDEAQLMFNNDYARTLSELGALDWYINLPNGVKNALINMNFNLGISKLLQFTHMIEALKKKDFTAASIAALNSAWCKQVGQRAHDIAAVIRQGR